MSSIHGKNTLSFRREKTSESSSTPIITKDIKFAHEASAGETNINLTALNLPSNLINFSNPTGTQLDAINLKANDSNLVLVSSLRGTLQLGLSYYVSTRDKITLTFAAAEGEIFTGHVRLTQATANVVDAQSFQITGTLTAGNTDIALGKAFNLNANSTTQIGEVILYINGVQQFRNIGNATAAPAADGNYEEVDAGNGKTNLLRINQALGVDVAYAVVSNGLIVEQDYDGHQQQIDSLAGQIDAMIPTVASLAGVPETNFQAGPNSVDLKAFADKLYQACDDIETNKTAQETGDALLETNKANAFTPVYARAYPSAFNFNVGSWGTIDWDNTLFDASGVLSTGNFVVPAGKSGYYKIDANITINDSGVGFSSYIELQLTINSTVDGGGTSPLPRVLTGWGSGDAYPAARLTGTVYLNAGDTVRILQRQNAGASRVTLGDNRSSIDIFQLTQD